MQGNGDKPQYLARPYLEKTLGWSIYSALPGVVDNTFGFAP